MVTQPHSAQALPSASRFGQSRESDGHEQRFSVAVATVHRICESAASSIRGTGHRASPRGGRRAVPRAANDDRSCWISRWGRLGLVRQRTRQRVASTPSKSMTRPARSCAQASPGSDSHGWVTSDRTPGRVLARGRELIRAHSTAAHSADRDRAPSGAIGGNGDCEQLSRAGDRGSIRDHARSGQPIDVVLHDGAGGRGDQRGRWRSAVCRQLGEVEPGISLPVKGT